MDLVQLEFSIISDHPRELTEPVVALGDFDSKCSGAVVYDNSPQLTALWVDILMGRPLAPRLVLRKVESVEQLFCLAIFMDRELALHPKVPGLVSSVELVQSLGLVGLAHVEEDLARLLVFLDQYVFEKAGPKEVARKLEQALIWIREYTLEGRLPGLPPPPEPPHILDQGTNGFVVAETSGPVSDALVGVYRQGFLRGVIFGRLKGAFCPVLVFRKSRYLRFDIETAALRLNQCEVKTGQEPAWIVEGHHLYNPGTSIPRDIVTQILLRV